MLDDRAIVIGRRRKKPVFILTGIVLLLFSANASYLVLRSIDRTPYKPTRWLLADLSASNRRTASKAWTELQRRDRQDRLSVENRARLYDLCIAEQIRLSYRGPMTIEMINYVAAAYQAGRLSAKQIETFFQQLIKLNLRIRETVVTGRRVPYRISELDRGPTNPFWYKPIIGQMSVDGRRLDDRITLGETLHGYGTGSRQRFRLPPQPPGEHKLTVRLTASLYNVPARSDRDNHPFRQIPLVLEAPFLVHETALTDDVRLVTDAALDNPVRAAIVTEVLAFNPYADNRFEGTFRITTPPVDLAFEVFVRFDGREYPVGVLWSAPDRSPLVRRLSAKLPIAPRSTVDLIFRPSKPVARDTVDLVEIFGREIVYPNVTLAGIE